MKYELPRNTLQSPSRGYNPEMQAGKEIGSKVYCFDPGVIREI